MHILSRITILFIILITQVSCNGHTDNNQPPINNLVKLIDYNFINKKMARVTLLAPQKHQLRSNGSMTAGVDDILDIGALAYPALGPLASIGDWLNNTTTVNGFTQTINSMMGEIQNLQSQITTLQTAVNFLNSDFMNYVRAQTDEEATAAYNDFMNSIGAITNQSTGIYYIFLANTGITNFNEPVNYTNLVSNIPRIDTALSGQSGFFTTSVNNISDSQLPANATTPVYKSVETITGSTLEVLYQHMQSYLYINLPEFPNQTSNIAPMIESYNNQIMYIYQIAAQTLQTAYLVDAGINQINYWQMRLNPSGQSLNQLETNNNVFYHYTGLPLANEQTAYTNAQTQLAYLYAARFNNLYSTTLKYIVSDQPFNNFIYPSAKTGNQEIDEFLANYSYANNVKSTIPSTNMQGSTGAQNFPTINNNGSNTSTTGFIFYMYDGLNQYTQCQNAFLTNNQFSSTNCPSIFSGYPIASSPGFYDGHQLQVWFMPISTNKPVLSVLTNLASRCSLSNQTWNVKFAYVAFNNTAGFSCTVMQNNLNTSPNPAFMPNWYYSASSSDPHNTFTWQTRGVNYEWVLGGSGSPELNNGQITLETAQTVTNSNFSFGINFANYSSALIFQPNINVRGGMANVNFPFYCPTIDPLCFPYSGNQGAGICFGGQYITIYQNGELNNIGFIQNNGSC